MQSTRRTGQSPPLLFLIGGVLPLLGVISELASGLFADVAVPLFPTGWHVAWALGSSFLAMLLHLGLYHRPSHQKARLVLLGVVTGTTLYYTLAALPYLPLMLLAIAAAGLGLLALAPFWTALGLLWLWPRCVREARAAGIAAPAILGLGLLGTLPLPALAWGHEIARLTTARDLGLAAHDAGEDGVAARQRLADADPAALAALCEDGLRAPARRVGAFGGQATLPGVLSYWLTWCYAWPDVTAERAREVFYRVHGSDWSRHAAGPQRGGLLWDGPRRFENAAGSSAEQGVIEGLRWRDSELRFQPAAAAAVTAIDWSMGFSNDTRSPQELRLEFGLPPGGVATGLSLWVGGVERPAAFAGEASVTAAYQEIAQRQRRDPALLREVAPGRVRLLVFPLPPAVTTRVRVTFAVPLLPHRQGGRQVLRPVAIESGNMEVPRGFVHHVEVDGEKWSVAAPALADWSLTLPPAQQWSFTRDAEGVLAQELAPRLPAPRTGPLVLCLDGSASAGLSAAERRAVIGAFPPGTPCTVVVATGEGTVQQRGFAGDAALGDWLAGLRFQGGVDSADGIRTALQAARGVPGATVVWLHGEQPVQLPADVPVAAVVHEAEQPEAAALVTVALSPHRHLVRDALARAGRARTLPRQGTLPDDLARLWQEGFADGPADHEPFAVLQRTFTRPMAPPAGAVEVRDGLARLHAAYAARALRAAGRADEGRALAARFRVVTADAGAVVLETEADYQRFGLDPGARTGLEPQGPPGGEPVPEPGTWLLLGSGLAVVLGARRRQRSGGAGRSVTPGQVRRTSSSSE